MQWTPTFYFKIIGKVQYFLIIAIPYTFHFTNRKEI